MLIVFISTVFHNMFCISYYVSYTAVAYALLTQKQDISNFTGILTSPQSKPKEEVSKYIFSPFKMCALIVANISPKCKGR